MCEWLQISDYQDSELAAFSVLSNPLLNFSLYTCILLGNGTWHALIYMFKHTPTQWSQSSCTATVFQNELLAYQVPLQVFPRCPQTFSPHTGHKVECIVREMCGAHSVFFYLPFNSMTIILTFIFCVLCSELPDVDSKWYKKVFSAHRFRAADLESGRVIKFKKI